MTTDNLQQSLRIWPIRFFAAAHSTIRRDIASVLQRDPAVRNVLEVLLCYSGLLSIPRPYYQAAQIDGASRWNIFRHVELPKLKRVLTIAILLRFLDSFMIYVEPFILTRGGPDRSTVFLSHDLMRTAVQQFDLGQSSAIALVYLSIILLFSWILFKIL